MKQPIQFDPVADLYDRYVRADFDIPFFLKETEGYGGEILELMCGTGRVSVPLLEAGRRMTCVDYSKGMLEAFAGKIRGKNYLVRLVQMDVTQLNLDQKFSLTFLPFHSLSEILSSELQRKAIYAIAAHLEPGGTFILTLQNPAIRLQTADGITRVYGEFPMEQGRKLVVSMMNKYKEADQIVSGFQYYEIFGPGNKLEEKRTLEINFKPVTDMELREMIRETGLQIAEMFGDYSYGSFDPGSSSYMVYKMVKK